MTGDDLTSSERARPGSKRKTRYRSHQESEAIIAESSEDDDRGRLNYSSQTTERRVGQS